MTLKAAGGVIALSVLAVTVYQARSLRRVSASAGRSAVPSTGAVSDEIGSVQDAAFAGGSWYVADPKNSRIAVLDAGGGLRKTIGRRGSGPGEMIVPRTLAAAAGRIYVSEFGKDGVTVYDTGGRYVANLRGSGQCGMIVQLAAVGMRVFALRRCMLPDNRVRLALDVSDGSQLVAWGGADTLGTPGSPVVPLTAPLIAADSAFVILGEGTLGCLQRFRTTDGMPAGRRCLDEVSRVPTADSVRRRIQARMRGRVSVPESLPRAIRIALVHGQLAALVPYDADHEAWKRFDWIERGAHPMNAVDVMASGQSFLTDGGQLVTSEGAEGIVITVVTGARP